MRCVKQRFSISHFSHHGDVRCHPTSVDRPRLPAAVPRRILDANLALTLERAEPRVRAMLILAAFAGLRAQEIAGVQRQDVLEHLDSPMLVESKSKGHREPMVPLHADVRKG